MSSTPQQQRREKETVGTPLTPSVSSRKNEKEQMVNLNNRMAVYVEKVRSLETENSKLTYQVSTYEETSKMEVTKIKQMYEAEVNGLRKKLDEATNEKNGLFVLNQDLKEKAESEKARADGLARDNPRLEAKVKELSKQMRHKDAMYSEANKERNDAVKELKTLKAQLAERTEEANTNAQLLQEETLRRIDTETLNQTLLEKLRFQEKLFEEQLSETKKCHQVKVTEIDEQVRVGYESKLEQALIDLRDQQNAEMDQFKEDLEAHYSAKIENMRKQMDLYSSDRYKGDEERKSAVSKVRRLEATIVTLQEDCNASLRKISDLEARLDHAQEMKRAAVEAAEKERDAARIKLDEMEKDYAELSNIKLQLDMEINTYRKLLEEEESRLHISPSPSSTGSRTRTRAGGKKRKRIAQQTVESQASAKRQQKEATITTTTYTTETTTSQKQGGSSSKQYGVAVEEDANKSCAVM